MSDNLKIIIPAAGAGTRLRPHTYTQPKSLLPVAGKPMIAHVLDQLLILDPAEICFVIGYLGDMVKDFVENHYDFNASFVEQKDLLGLGYAVNLALERIKGGPLLIVLGDTIARTDYKKFVEAGHNVIGLQKVDDPRRFGVANTEGGKIIAFEEKPQHPKSNLAIIGLYYFEDSEPLHRQLNKVIDLDKRTGGEIQLTDALDYMLHAGAVFTPYEVSAWLDCGKVETMLETNRFLLEEVNEYKDYPGSIIIPPVFVDASAEVEQSIIGPYVSVSAGAKIVKSIVSDSIIFEQAVVEDSLLEASLIGENVKVRGNFRQLNLGESSGISH
jgi:glucose-1-phosphate thymidylyltransferase